MSQNPTLGDNAGSVDEPHSRGDEFLVNLARALARLMAAEEASESSAPGRTRLGDPSSLVCRSARVGRAVGRIVGIRDQRTHCFPSAVRVLRGRGFSRLTLEAPEQPRP